ncbi:MAG: hypothetical protein C0390_09090 [Syntrophus sp. (in: bacteria)]|nr:hypothetical protein [Syntrophus sp. (in: bacteria)]
MKKIFAMLFISVFAVSVFAFAAEQVQPELRPAQKLMQARAAWMTAMTENLAAKKFEAVAKDATELAAQTKKVGENHPNPLGKELTLAVSSLAGDVSAAAAKKDGDTVKARLGEIKGKCGECHAKIRDKK